MKLLLLSLLLIVAACGCQLFAPQEAGRLDKADIFGSLDSCMTRLLTYDPEFSEIAPLMANVQGEGSVPVTALEPPVLSLLDQHDAYINGDPALSEAQRAVYLLSSESLRVAIQAALGDN